MSRPSPRGEVCPGNGQGAADIRFVGIEQLRTSYEHLRPAALPIRPELSAELPLRVVPTEQQGIYEVVDGFKRLAQWRERGHTIVPVVVEPAAGRAEHKRLLLVANAPARTITALDEARVVCSYLDQDHWTAERVGRFLGHELQWVKRRIELGTKLSPGAQDRLAQGNIGPTLASALTALPDDEQELVLGAIETHGLRPRESVRLVEAWQAADEHDRKALLRNPADRLRAERSEQQILSPRAVQLQAQLMRIGEALAELEAFRIFGFPDRSTPSAALPQIRCSCG